jgi:ubiquinone/menaquinone biosynthesis C-methylase UbiE
MNDREAFYQTVVRDLIPDTNASILVCGGGATDKTIFESLGFRDVTISNLDERIGGNEYAPFTWKYENAESLSFQAGSFDYVVIHAAIHHASSPHKVLTEMYRVARKATLAFESRDSVIMRVLEKYALTQTYEHTAVYYNDCKYGGVNNTEIPNYIYRWTEREIEKTIHSYAPHSKHRIIYRYGTGFPSTSEHEIQGQWKARLLKVMRPFYGVFVRLFPRQQNLFAFYVEKPTLGKLLYPWLSFDDKQGKITFRKEWGDQKYKSPAKCDT